jgi:hypothetical protein
MASQYIPSSELSFEAYKASLKNFLKSQKRFKDYDFEGSNLAVLIDLLTFNTYNNAHFGNMVGSEAGFIDTAQLRESKVSHAKSLNYVPRSRISARTTIDIEISPNDQPSAITIPKYYAFKSSNGNGSVRFLTDQAIVLTPDGQGRYRISDVTIYEGELVTERFTVDSVTLEDGITTYDQLFNLQSANIDASSIEVNVYSDENVEIPITKTRADTLYGLTPESDIFFVRGYKDNYYTVEFGDGILGRPLVAGNIVEIRYRDTIGSEGNGSFVFNKTTPIDGYSSITITTLGRASGGAERESSDSITYNATRHFQVQERAVIDSDFEVLVKENFPEIQSVAAYSGDVLGHYGKVYIVLKPRDTSGIVTNTVKNRIVEFIKTKTLVPEPVIQDADYYFLRIEGEARFGKNSTSDSRNDISNAIVNKLLSLNQTNLSDFNANVDQNTIVDPIKTSHPAIVGSSVDLNLVKRWSPVLGVNETLSFDCNNSIRASKNGAYVNLDSYGVKTSSFQTIWNDRIITAVIQDNGIGSLHLYEVLEGSSVLQRTNTLVGSVDYDAGSVKITLDVYGYTDYIDVNLIMSNKTISVSQNRWISIDSPYVNVVPVPV